MIKSKWYFETIRLEFDKKWWSPSVHYSVVEDHKEYKDKNIEEVSREHKNYWGYDGICVLDWLGTRNHFLKILNMSKRKYNVKERVGVYSKEMVLNQFYNDEYFNFRKQIDGKVVKFRWLRMKTFKNSLRCAICNLEANYFALEKDINLKEDLYHFSLYGITKGKERLFTIDHRKAKSKGGENNLDNYATCCYECNQLKGDKAELYIEMKNYI